MSTVSDVAGTATLTRTALRRDRIALPAWALGATALTLYAASAIEEVYADPADLSGMVEFARGPAGTILTGPGYGLDEPTYEAVFAAQYGLWVMIVVAFMSVLLVIRHTRADEETGRAEMLRASVTGRYSALASAVGVVVIANVITAILVGGTLAAYYDTGGAVLFAVSLAAVGLCFGAIAAVVVQLVEHARTATALSSAVIGGAVVVRGVGDVIGDHGSALSWLFPFAWAQQTRVFVDARWWPLLLAVALTIMGLWVAAWLQMRRDVGAGLVRPRLSHAAAAPWLRSPWALALRLERGAIVGWSIGIVIVAVMFGSLASTVQDSFADLSGDVLALFGGDAAQLIDGFLGTMVLFHALAAAAYGVTAVHRLTSEESTGRAEAVLATAVARTRWMAAALVAALVGIVVAMVGAGLGMGVAAAAVTSDSSYVGSLLGAHLAYLPAIGVVVAVAALGFGVRSRLTSLAWAVVGFGFVVGFFGDMLGFPSAVSGLSPFEHVALAPLEDLVAVPLVVLAAIAVLLTGAGLVLFRRRDLASTA